MKKYGTDLEREYNAVCNRIRKRAKFLNKKVNNMYDLSNTTIEDDIAIIKQIEKHYVESTRQLDAFS